MVKWVVISEEQPVVKNPAARWIVGEKLRHRAAAGPDYFNTTTPRLEEYPMKSLQQVRSNKVTRLRPNMLTVQRPRFGGAKRQTLPALRAETKISKKGMRTSW